jgi:hypothetical protein
MTPGVFRFEIGRNAFAKTTCERFPFSGFEALRFGSRRLGFHPGGRYARVHSFRTLLGVSTRLETALYALDSPTSIAVQEHDFAVTTKRLSDCHARNRTNLFRLTGSRNYEQAAMASVNYRPLDVCKLHNPATVKHRGRRRRTRLFYFYGTSVRAALWLRNVEFSADLSSEVVRDFSVTRNRLDMTRLRIAPQFMFFTLTFEVAAELTKVASSSRCFTKRRWCLFPPSTEHHADRLPADPRG